MSCPPTRYEHIRIDQAGPLTWLVLNRPDRANALSGFMLDEFSDALERLRSSGGSVIAIRGEGKGFSAGMDIDQVGKAGPGAVDPTADRERLQRNIQRWLALWDHPKPIIAAVHGYCMAAATQMCIFTDITIVADDVRIGEPTVPIGGGYISPLWSTLVGPKRAKEFAFVPGNSIDGPTAVAWGWANHCVPAGRLIDVVETLGRRIAMVPPEVLRIKKLSINRAAEAQGFRAATAHVAEMDALLHLTPAVLAVRHRIADVGLKTVMSEYRVPSSIALMSDAVAQARESKPE